MKFLNLVTTVTLLVAASGVVWAAECDTPEKTAKFFLQYDFEGSRLSSDESARIDDLETDDMHEPGWDISTLTTGYKVKSIKEKGSEATVSVLFGRAWETEEKFEREKVKDQEAELQLRKVDGCWKITPPIYNPHVSATVVLKHFRNLETEASRHPSSQSEKEYLIWVRQQISNFQEYQAAVSQNEGMVADRLPII
jgi:hypothetical protein